MFGHPMGKVHLEFEFIVPRSLEEAPVSMDVDNEEASGTPTIVVCSGELVEKVSRLKEGSLGVY